MSDRGWVRDGARKVLRVIPEAGQRFYSDHCPQQAAGIAYRVLFSIAPLAIVLVSVFGLVLQNDDYREDVIDSIVDALPVSAQGHNDVENAIRAIATPSSAAGLLSLVLFVWAATGMMTSIRQGLETAMQVTRARGRRFAASSSTSPSSSARRSLVLLTAAVTVVGGAVEKAVGRIGGSGMLARALVHGGAFAVTVGVVLLLYRFVPARGLRIRDGLAGAIVTGILLQLDLAGLYGLHLRQGDDESDRDLHGFLLTAALVFLYSVYLYSSALLLGAEVAGGVGPSRSAASPGPRYSSRSSVRSSACSSPRRIRRPRSRRIPLAKNRTGLPGRDDLQLLQAAGRARVVAGAVRAALAEAVAGRLEGLRSPCSSPRSSPFSASSNPETCAPKACCCWLSRSHCVRSCEKLCWTPEAIRITAPLEEFQLAVFVSAIRTTPEASTPLATAASIEASLLHGSRAVQDAEVQPCRFSSWATALLDVV